MTGVGRAMLCVRRNLPHNVVRTSVDKDFEYVACTVRFDATTAIIVVSTYLAPNVRISSEQVNDLLTGLPVPFIICGDFNAHSAIWGNAHSDVRGRLLEKVIDDI